MTKSVPVAASQHSQAKAAEGRLLTHETQERLTPGKDAGLLGAQAPRLFCSSTALGSPLLRRKSAARLELPESDPGPGPPASDFYTDHCTLHTCNCPVTVPVAS